MKAGNIGFEFIGVRFEAMRGGIETSVSEKGKQKFFDKLDTRIEADRRAGRTSFTSALEYVFEQWSPQAVTDDAFEMRSLGLGLINDAAESIEEEDQ